MLFCIARLINYIWKKITAFSENNSIMQRRGIIKSMYIKNVKSDEEKIKGTNHDFFFLYQF